jgi:putative ABC transport system permease protein
LAGNSLSLLAVRGSLLAETRRASTMSSALQDLRYALRLLRRSPGFSAIAIAALAIGIGANTAIFSVINTLLLQPLPYRDADHIAIVWEHNLPRDRKTNVVAPANYLHWRDLNQTFDELGAASPPYNVTLTAGGEPEEIVAQSVTSQMFTVLGMQPAIGRVFTPQEELSTNRVAVISDRLWRRRFGADRNILGHPIVSQGIAYTVLGIMPPSFSFLDKTVDIWVPLGLTEQSRTPRGRSLSVAGRLKPGVSIERAQVDMTRVGNELVQKFPAFNTGWTVRVVSVREQLTGGVRPALFVLAGAVAFVLLIACANVANLLLARATARQRELGIRLALGAGRTRLLRQLLAESFVLSVAGGLAGLALAWWSLTFLRVTAAASLPVQRLELVRIDPTVLAFVLGISIVSGLAFGLVPALTSTDTSLNESLKEGGRTGSASRGRRTRSALVVLEVALALMLLVGAGLLLRSFRLLLDVNPGFDPSRTTTMRLSLPTVRYGAEGKRAQFFERLFPQVDALPGVQASGGISWLPLNGLGAATSFAIVGQAKPPLGQEPVTDVRVITHDYFKAMGIPLLKGRGFNDQDPADWKGRVVINETFARNHWPNDDPIGKHIQIHWDDVEDEVIGVVGDVKHVGLDGAVRAMTYWPFQRNPYGTMTIAVRTINTSITVDSGIRSIVRQLDPGLVVAGIKSMETVVADSVAERRLTMLLLSAFAGAALLLAAVGIYGVIAYAVTQRTQEIGIRMALGAQQADVLRMVVKQGALLVSIGIAAGAIGAFAVTRLMTSMLYEVAPSDPLTFGAVSAVLGLIALVASYIPGRRATRVDPVIALRAE